jgi:hypothetical protein
MKRYVWAFAVSITVFLVCTYYVARRVEAVEDRVVAPVHEAAPIEAHPHEVLPLPAPQAGSKAPPRITVRPAAQTTSVVAIIQAISGLIAALTGLLGVIKSFRRERAVPPAR